MLNKMPNRNQILMNRRKGLYITEETRDETKLSLKQMRDDDVTITLQHHSGMFGMLNLRELLQQMKIWKEIGAKCLPFNHKEVEVGKQKVWMWIIQPKEMTPVSPLALAYGTMVSGYAYISKNKSVGEMVIRYLGCEKEA